MTSVIGEKPTTESTSIGIYRKVTTATNISFVIIVDLTNFSFLNSFNYYHPLE